MDPRFDPKLQPPLDTPHTRGRFKEKVALVTGGASGIGLATVHRFLNDGAKVAIFDINEETGKLAEEHFKQEHEDVKFFRCDVSNDKQCIDCVKQWADLNNGRIDFLVNCAVSFITKGLNSTPSDWDISLKVNVVGTSNMVQACMEYLPKDHGCIVNLSSTSGFQSQINRWTYAAGKAAIAQVTRCMALDLAEHGIRVNAVAPTWTWSPQVAKVTANGTIEELFKICGKFHLIPRVCLTTEVAAVILFLCSRDASYVNGSIIPVDGGYNGMGPEGKGESSVFADE